MQKKIKLLSKIVFLLIVSFLFYKISILTFKEDQIVTEKSKKIYEVSQEKIISSGQEIVIKSFETIEQMTWLNNDQLLIEGTVDNKKGDYVFDTISNELMLYSNHPSAEFDYGELSFVREIPDYGALCTKGTQIGLLKEGTFEVLAENATYEENLKFQLSEDLSKLVYYHNGNDNIVTYSFEKDFYRTINTTLDEQIKSNFNDLVQVSPSGGYVSIEHRTEELDESYFSIYGADSGKLYADNVFGIYLSWSPGDAYVCYYYSKESSKLDSGTIDGMDIGSQRIGYYDVSAKEIKYIDSSVSEKMMLSNIYWSDQSITTITGTVTDHIQFESILSYDFKTNTFNEWLLELDPIPIGSDVELLDYTHEFVLLLQSEAQHQVMRIMKNSKEIIVYEHLLPFNTLEEKGIYFYNAEGTFITVDHEKMTVSDAGFQGFIGLNDSAFITLPNDAMNHIAVWLTGKHEIKILNTN